MKKYSTLCVLLIAVIFLKGCGTIYIPQVLPEARGIGKSIGQEGIEVAIIPMTNRTIKTANKLPYVRRVIEASDLTEPAKLVSVEEAINQNLPLKTQFESYQLGIGDQLLITQEINFVPQISAESEVEEQKQAISARSLTIADDGFVSILGVGRLPMAGLTQFQAEDLLYKAFVRQQINPEFELQISGFNSKKIYFFPSTASATTTGSETLERTIIPFTNNPIYLHQVLAKNGAKIKKGEDSVVILKRNDQLYRMSYKAVLDGTIDDIRILAEDRIFLEPLPYRPEIAILVGEVNREKLFSISASGRESLAEALYADGGVMIKTSSDTSQIFVIRESLTSEIVAYHLDSSNPARLTLAAKFELRPNDIIYVAPQFVTNYNRALVQIFSAYDITEQLVQR